MPGKGFHGREPELGVIAGALDAVARGGRRLLVVGGEAGIGKTALLAELRDRAAAEGFVVLEGRAGELEQDIPLVALIDAIAPQLPTAKTLAALPAGHLRLLAGAFPAIAAPAGEDGERWRLYRALGDLVELIAGGRPLLLLVDDLHWADSATQELLELFVRRPPADSLL